MRMAKYILKRLLLMFFVLAVIVTVCFLLVRMLPRTLPDGNLAQQSAVLARWDALGYNKPLLEQYAIYINGIFTRWDFGTSWYIKYMEPAWDLLVGRLLPTVMVNFYSLIFSSSLASKTMPVAIAEFNGKFTIDYGMISVAGILGSLIPVLITVVFQKYIVMGMTAGGVKE